MIFVAVGNARNPFQRLVEAADQAAASLEEEVVIQCGNTPYEARHARLVPFVSLEEFERLMREARIVVVHGGCGSVITAARYGKPTIVMPRRKMFGEHVNDHQLEIAETFAREGRVCKVETFEELAAALKSPPAPAPSSDRQVPSLLVVLGRWMQIWAVSGRVPSKRDLAGVLPSTDPRFQRR